MKKQATIPEFPALPAPLVAAMTALQEAIDMRTRLDAAVTALPGKIAQAERERDAAATELAQKETELMFAEDAAAAIASRDEISHLLTDDRTALPIESADIAVVRLQKEITALAVTVTEKETAMGRLSRQAAPLDARGEASDGEIAALKQEVMAQRAPFVAGIVADIADHVVAATAELRNAYAQLRAIQGIAGSTVRDWLESVRVSDPRETMIIMDDDRAANLLKVPDTSAAAAAAPLAEIVAPLQRLSALSVRPYVPLARRPKPYVKQEPAQMLPWGAR